LFQSLLEHPAVLDLTKHILGPTMLNESYLVHSCDANVARPGGQEQHLHLDRTKLGDGQTRPLQSRFVFCLDQFEEENGATRLVPGSHLWNDRIDATRSTHYESVPAEAPSGSLIVFTDMLLHGTGANVTADRERVSVNFGYCPPWYRPMINYPLALDPDAMEGTSRTLRQLLGLSETMIVDEPWDSASEKLRALCVSPTMDW
jgi:ectoine hydroxylase-related dioxygenase (phytanoyl-CoA dioxygenase family)